MQPRIRVQGSGFRFHDPIRMRIEGPDLRDEARHLAVDSSGLLM